MDIDLLVQKAKENDKEALVQLIMAKRQEYYKLAYVYLENQEDALDALAEMIVILYEKIHSLRKTDAFYSWSKTILVNCCKNILRKRKKIIYLDKIEDEGYEPFHGKEEYLLLENNLRKLGTKHQEILKLRYFLDLEYETIAALLKIPLGTVKSRINIGLRRLKELFGGDLG